MSEKLKSAYELAMERLRVQDRDEGVKESTPLTAKQKAEIADLREQARAKRAEVEILYRKNRASATDPTKLAEIDEHYGIDRRRIDSWLDSAVARVRRGEPAAEPEGS